MQRDKLTADPKYFITCQIHSILIIHEFNVSFNQHQHGNNLSALNAHITTTRKEYYGIQSQHLRHVLNWFRRPREKKLNIIGKCDSDATKNLKTFGQLQKDQVTKDVVYNGLNIFKTYQQLRRGEESKIDSDELLINKHCNQSWNKKKDLTEPFIKSIVKVRSYNKHTVPIITGAVRWSTSWKW